MEIECEQALKGAPDYVRANPLIEFINLAANRGHDRRRSGPHLERIPLCYIKALGSSKPGSRFSAYAHVYLVLEGFGRLGSAWLETDDDRTGRETLIRDLLAGEYHRVRIVASTTSEGWSRDVTVEIAEEVWRRFVEQEDVPSSVQDFIEANRRLTPDASS